MTLPTSHLDQALDRMAARSASAIVARVRSANTALNTVLLRRLSAAPGLPESLLAAPVYEAAKAWKPGDSTLADLAGNLLDPRLVQALDQADPYQMPKGRPPYFHQLAAWRAALDDKKSVLVTSGTGSGKTECFLIPILNDILTRTRAGAGVQAILLYPLNALIESQRERLSVWAEGLGGRVRFALYNGDTPETAFKAGGKSGKVELTNRNDIRDSPPDILVTNISMLEYLLLRAKDRPILDASQGALRWIVLDEAHSYIGSQAAEMALLLRRVRAAFGVAPEQVRLMATSATIGGEANALEKLADFTAALAGVGPRAVAVIEGQEQKPILPATGPDTSFDLDRLDEASAADLWQALAPHPRIQKLHLALNAGPCRLDQVAAILFDDPSRRHDAQRVMDLAALASGNDRALLPWRAHLFHRAQGGVFACIDPACPDRDPELAAPEAAWPFGAIQANARPECRCGAAVFEVVTCKACGTPHLQALCISGAQSRLELPEGGEGDDYAQDAEPGEPGDADGTGEAALALLAPPGAPGLPVFVAAKTGLIHENGAPEGETSWPVNLVDQAPMRGCCDEAEGAALDTFRFSPAFFLGNALPNALEDLAAPEAKPGLPAGGRRAISFTDSRQGVARLAAKLQQEAERSLTRAFLYHAVQESGGGADPARAAELETKVAKLKAVDPAMFADQIAELETQLDVAKGTASKPVTWPDLVLCFAEHHELKAFAGEVWANRRLGDGFRNNPTALAQMFLFRELFRRPKVQNNPETMGLIQLVFPRLDSAALTGALPEALRRAGADAQTWRGLAYLAIDYVFRDPLATNVPEWMVPIVSPRFGRLKSVAGPETRLEDTDKTVRLWPGATWSNRPGRLHKAVYGLIKGDPGNPQHQDMASDVLERLWALLKAHALIAVAPGLYRLDFGQAAVARLDEAWLCPVTRRPFGYAIAGRSPYDPDRPMARITFPRPPLAHSIGLTEAEHETITHWCATDPQVADLRRRGLWSNMTDRVAGFPAFIRAQEHSAQIERKVLQSYEERFNKGEINLLNCSTTMEMGVDLAAVQLVVNANVPPALSNYRQRVGRAGRRREPWAFGLTFCRDLPLDRQAFLNPVDFLTRPIAAPKVWLESAPLVQRHVNAFLLGQWLASQGGIDVKADTGSFIGLSGDDAEGAASPADRFLQDLGSDWARRPDLSQGLQTLVTGTAQDRRDAAALIGQTAAAMETLMRGWRQEYRQTLDRAEGMEEDAAKAFELRAKRMAGEFLLGEIARRGFTPAYGFPTDVVSFDPLISGRSDAETRIGFDARGGATRELHQAIREYAPGCEVVIDGLVYQSEGIRPAWGADQDVSKLEDLKEFWDCETCHSFGVSTSGTPLACPDCGGIAVTTRKVLRPAGFLTAKPPHTGYENLARSPYLAPRVSAQGADWVALPDPAAGRLRHDPQGRVVTRSGGALGGGFALCLDCGRAEPMEEPRQGIAAAVPKAMLKHRALARNRATRLTSDGYCPGGYTAPHRVQRHIHLAQITRTDVFELQLPPPVHPDQILALAAALREALCARLGVEIAEIGLTAGVSTGPDQGKHVSAWLLDRAAGGAGLVARLNEAETFAAVLAQAERLLACPEDCGRGCPSCILQPDLNQQDVRLDRRGALVLARQLLARLVIPPELQVFGPQTRSLGGSLIAVLDRLRRAGGLGQLRLFLHGAPDAWNLQGWNARRLIDACARDGVPVDIVLTRAALTHAGLDLASKLALHSLGQHATIRALDALPRASDLPVVAMLSDRAGEWRAVAALMPEEAAITDAWAMGTLGANLSGPVTPPAALSAIVLQKLMEYGTGNGRIMTPKGELDGPILGFGKRLWAWLGASARLEILAMKQIGLAELRYTDRYLLSPSTLLLLAEAVKAAPGLGQTKVRIDLGANGDRRGPLDHGRVHDNYDDDTTRRETLAALLPGARIEMAAHRNDLPHRREMSFTLNDGRSYRLLFDQGFGGLRVQGAEMRHDFRASPEQQARSLSRSTLRTQAGDEPVVWETIV